MGATSSKRPVFEHILAEATDSFVWRLDDYPFKRMGWHIHPECEIHLIRESSGIELVGDHIGEFAPGRLTIVGGDLPHDWVTSLSPGETVRGRDIVVQFDAGRWCQAAAILPELAMLEPFLARASRGLGFHGETREKGAQILESMGQARGLDRLCLLFRLLALLAGSHEYEILSSEDFMPNRDPAMVDTVQQVMSYLFDHFTSDIRLTDLANMVGMSESAFSRFFQKNSGNSFTDHVMKLRLGRACKLLADSDMPITDICFEVGYANISNFNRNFRQQRGLTPSLYRRWARQRIIDAPSPMDAS
ncbi:AraC family transcriptional regulator [Beijerinckia indica]|uniref:Transcriptional regulator, AraC family n=1 Tax=Beijerinckia indica subsp. indica (strain ATCC 9039 / DSM 1715 / NCIMB 8712) TaxID=395963 RepID=B2IHG7_BEII9|nr:AraC family transcriptional regulator [Beijerinckia indica]ACB95952.1 transcriptional regulator, AraC family [Beijerinckia indica subsp. indica ATCC 9039]